MDTQPTVSSARLLDGTAVADLVNPQRREIALRLYQDREIFDMEMEKIFARSWIPVAHESELPQPGDFVKRYIGQDSCIVVRDDDGSISVLLNACTHRGMPLCRAEKGQSQNFKCPYHGWAFSRKGRFLGAPFEKQMYGDELRREAESLQLVRAQTAMLGGLVFANWDQQAEPFDDYLGAFGFYLRAALERTNRGLEAVGPPQRHVMRANWKLLAEQLADGYHARALHQSAADLGALGHNPNDPAAWGMLGINVSTDSGHTLRCIDMKLAYNFAGLSENASLSDKLGAVPPPGTDARLSREFPDNLSESQMKLLAETPPLVMGLFPGADFFTLMGVGGGAEQSHGPIMVARTWIPRAPDSFEMLTWILVERDAPDELRKLTLQTTVRNFGISGYIEQDDAEAWQGIQRTAEGVLGRRMKSRYAAQVGIVRPDDFDGGGNVHAGFSRDDAQWAWWRAYAEAMSV